jgi:hypothetical protein
MDEPNVQINFDALPFFENGLPSKMSGLASPMAHARI